MKKTGIFLSVLMFSTLAFAEPVEVQIRATQPQAGMDYPTCSPPPAWAKKSKILVINSFRIGVEGLQMITFPMDDYDYDAFMPDLSWVEHAKILVLEGRRLPVILEKAKAGIDFATDGPADMERDFIVWKFSNETRLPLRNILRIERAVPKRDFPVYRPTDFIQDFYVIVTHDQQRIVLK